MVCGISTIDPKLGMDVLVGKLKLTPASETDLYRFTAAAGDRFFFDMQARIGAPSPTTI